MNFPWRTSLSRAVVGLDLGGTRLRAVEVLRTAQGPQIQQVTSLTVPDARGAMAREGIKELWERTPGLSRTVVVALRSHEVEVKRMEVERMPADDFARILPFEFEAFWSEPRGSEVLDFQILNRNADTPSMDVLVVAVQREVAEARVRLIREAGLTLCALDLEPFALQNGLANAVPETRFGWVALLDLEADEARLNLALDGVPVGFQSDLWERGLDRPDPHDDGQSMHLQQLALAVKEDLAAVVDQVRVGFNHPQAGAGEPRVGALYLSGSGASNPDAIQQLAAHLDVPVHPVSPFQGLTVLPSVRTPLSMDRRGTEFLLALGLGLRT
jgi:Tfp pilus assembly PilM family ATPase